MHSEPAGGPAAGRSPNLGPTAGRSFFSNLGPAGGRVLPAVVVDDLASDGTSVDVILAGLVSDADAGARRGLDVTGLTATAGTRWQYTTNDGGEWHDLGAQSDERATLLGAFSTNRVRVLPGEAGENTLTFRAWDRESGAIGDRDADASANGGSSAFSASWGSPSSSSSWPR